MNKQYRAASRADEGAELVPLLARREAAACKLRQARMLIKGDAGDEGPGWPAAAIAPALDVGVAIARVRRGFVEQGLASELSPYRGGKRCYTRQRDCDAEAPLFALAGSPPQGRRRWRLSLLARQIVERAPTDRLPHAAVRQTLKKNALHPHRRHMWCIPDKPSAAFVPCREDVLEVYRRPSDPMRPVVCLDETFKQTDRPSN